MLRAGVRIYIVLKIITILKMQSLILYTTLQMANIKQIIHMIQIWQKLAGIPWDLLHTCGGCKLHDKYCGATLTATLLVLHHGLLLIKTHHSCSDGIFKIKSVFYMVFLDCHWCHFFAKLCLNLRKTNAW